MSPHALRSHEAALEFMALLPQLKRRFAASLPEELRAELVRVTPHQLEALCQLGNRADGVTMNELAAAQSCAVSTATALADRLVSAGLAERRSDPNDRRLVRLVTTARGQELTQSFSAARLELMGRAMERLTEDEQTTLLQLLRKVAGDEEVSE